MDAWTNLRMITIDSRLADRRHEAALERSLGRWATVRAGASNRHTPTPQGRTVARPAQLLSRG